PGRLQGEGPVQDPQQHEPELGPSRRERREAVPAREGYALVLRRVGEVSVLPARSATKGKPKPLVALRAVYFTTRVPSPLWRTSRGSRAGVPRETASASRRESAPPAGTAAAPPRRRRAGG